MSKSFPFSLCFFQIFSRPYWDIHLGILNGEFGLKFSTSTDFFFPSSPSILCIYSNKITHNISNIFRKKIKIKTPKNTAVDCRFFFLTCRGKNDWHSNCNYFNQINLCYIICTCDTFIILEIKKKNILTFFVCLSVIFISLFTYLYTWCKTRKTYLICYDGLNK